MKVNDIYEVKIIDINHNGNGIAKIEDFPIFVSKCNTGDVVKIRIVKVTKKYSVGKVISFIEKKCKSDKVLCPYYEKCGGCDLLHISYDKEKEMKRKYIERLFNLKVDIVSLHRFYYRNKVTIHVKDGKLGFYKENTNDLIEINECLLLNEEINKFIKFLENINLKDITSIIIKKGIDGLLVSFMGKLNDDDVLKLINYNKIVSLYLNNLLIYGKTCIVNKFGDIIYNINNNSFFQVNTECSLLMYQKAKEYIGKANKLLDLYCGMASIGIYLNDIAKEIVGIEINEDSVKCGIKNINDNNIKNYKIINSDASLINEDFDVVVVDPPRSGLSKDVINSLNNMKCNRVIYISCNPNTLKRDIDLLYEYELKNITVFNMFPCTKHIECVCNLELKNIK